jgi:hypothetical protein
MCELEDHIDSASIFRKDVGRRRSPEQMTQLMSDPLAPQAMQMNLSSSGTPEKTGDCRPGALEPTL